MKIRILLCISILSILFVGCNQETSRDNQTDPVRQNTNTGEVDVEQSSYEQNQQISNNQIATHLANVASDVPEVNDAAAVVAGPYAVVGVDINAQTDREQVGTIKYAVGEALKDDPYGKTAVVVADADMMQRFRDMNAKIGQGYPIQGVVEELAEIVGRYMPTFPVQENRPQEPSDNEQKLNEHQNEDELKEIREEQSNQNDPEQSNVNE